jgi:ribosome-associated toxin RatA of RatAB toxin-antitoxin module
MRVLEVLKEKHASRSLTRKAPLWREYVCFAEVYVDDAHIRMSLSHCAGDRRRSTEMTAARRPFDVLATGWKLALLDNVHFSK